MASQAPVQVLHVAGSPTSSFFFDLSIMYGRTCFECADLDRKNFEHHVAVVYSDGKWGFPTKMDEASVAKAGESAVSFGDAMARIAAMQPPVDVMLPHMFCYAGLTKYRMLSELLNIELLGCSGEICAIAEDKFLTKALCKVSGVPVPGGELLRREVHGANVSETAKMLMEKRGPPYIVKPAKEANSVGLSLVKEASQEKLAAALAHAFEHDTQILVEEYIAGREVRVAVLEVEGDDGYQLEVLPKLEYVLEDIREMKHKLGTDASGKLLSSDGNVDEAFKKAKTEGERICPAQLAPEVHQRIDDLAKTAHKMLGCKYYSLFDVRINHDGYPFMLEACLFCSFSPYSVIVSLAAQSDNPKLNPHPTIFENLLRRAAQETRTRREAAISEGALKKRKVETQ